MKTYIKDLSEFDFPKRSLIMKAFRHSRSMNIFNSFNKYIARKLKASKFVKKLDNVEIDFYKVNNGNGTIGVGATDGWGNGSIIIRFIYDDYSLIRVEYKRLNNNKIYKSYII